MITKFRKLFILKRYFPKYYREKLMKNLPPSDWEEMLVKKIIEDFEINLRCYKNGQ